MITLLIIIISCTGRHYNGSDDTLNNYITITGIAEETKDGYYISGYVLEHEEIQKYNHGKATGSYRNKKVEIIGKTKKVNYQCSPYDQCREGPYKVIYNLKSVKIIE